MLQTDLQEEVCWGEDPKTDGKKIPAQHTAPPVLVAHQLLTDLAVNLIPAQAEEHEGHSNKQDRCSIIRTEQQDSRELPGCYIYDCFTREQLYDLYLMFGLDRAYPTIT